MLNPVTVSVHFLLSIGMIAAAVVLFARAGEGDAPAKRVVHRDIRTLSYALSAAAFVLLLAGVVVTGTGPHSGDEAASASASTSRTWCGCTPTSPTSSSG